MASEQGHEENGKKTKQEKGKARGVKIDERIQSRAFEDLP